MLTFLFSAINILTVTTILAVVVGIIVAVVLFIYKANNQHREVDVN